MKAIDEFLVPLPVPLGKIWAKVVLIRLIMSNPAWLMRMVSLLNSELARPVELGKATTIFS